MKIKELPEDFRVTEIIDLDKLSQEKSSEDRNYLYYYLTKKNYTQNKAVDIIGRTFNSNHKFVHIAGTKDRAGITKQLICIAKSKRMQPEKHLEFFNSKFEDMNLEFVGEFPFRLNLGDNLGNSFEIIVRDLVEKEINKARENVEKLSQDGVLNYFDSQRFGYAGNSHIVGMKILKNDVSGALYEVLCSMPEHANEDHKAFVESVEKNWQSILDGNQEVIKFIANSAPKFLRNEISMVKHFHNARNDVSGALRLLPKKLRTLYIGAYQSYLFNRVLDEVEELPEELELCSCELSKDSLEYSLYGPFLKEDGLSLDDFSLPHMPELAPVRAMRRVRVSVNDLEVGESEEDELNEGKFKVVVCFSLGSGSYATNVIKQLFNT